MKGILIAGYGTRTGNLETILENQAAKLRARGRRNIYVGCFRVSSPSIPESLTEMVKDDSRLLQLLDSKITEFCGE